MATDIGRLVKYGLGKETVANTAVGASTWISQLAFNLNPKTDYANNEGSFGVIEKTNDSTALRSWTEGSMEAKLTSLSSGYVLLGAFGSVSTAANSDASTTIKDHTFTINQNVLGQTFTFYRKDSISATRFAGSRIGKWELTMDLDKYVFFKADIMAGSGSSTTATPAYVVEPEFVAKHCSVKTATTAAGLSGATAYASIQSFTLTVEPNLETNWQAGSASPESFTSNGYEMKFEMETRYNDQVYENAYKNGTALALQVTAKNTDVVIGTSANPGLVLTAPKMYITDWARKEDLGKPVTQKMTGTIHYSSSDAYSLKAILTNTQASY
jgi:hypothetical protein